MLDNSIFPKILLRKILLKHKRRIHIPVDIKGTNLSFSERTIQTCIASKRYPGVEPGVRRHNRYLCDVVHSFCVSFSFRALGGAASQRPPSSSVSFRGSTRSRPGAGSAFLCPGCPRSCVAATATKMLGGRQVAGGEAGKQAQQCGLYSKLTRTARARRAFRVIDRYSGFISAKVTAK